MTLNKSCAIGSVAITCTLWGALLVLSFAILRQLDDSYGWSFWLREHVHHWVWVALSVPMNAWILTTWTRHFYGVCNREARK